MKFPSILATYLEMLNLRELQYFIAIAEHGHFGKAARVVNVSQPTLSMQFKKLEESLGGKLIERLPRGAILTPLGEEVLPLARQILQLNRDLEQRCGAKESGGSVTIGVIPTISPYLLPKLNRGLSRHFKGRKVLLNEGQTAELIRLVKDGSLDVAILSTPIDEGGIEEIEIFSEPFFLAVNRSHPLAKRKKVNLNDLQGEKLLLLEEGHCLRKQALSICNFPQANDTTDLSATSIETLRSMVSLGVGVTLMPQLAIRKGDPLSYIPFSSPSPARMVGLIYRSSFYDQSLIMMLGELVKGVAASERLVTLL